LLEIPAPIKFLSCEPLLGKIDITKKGIYDGVTKPIGFDNKGRPIAWSDSYPKDILVDWVIAGGESGPGARPMHPAWVRSLRDQCVEAGIPFFFKQWGEWAPVKYIYVDDPYTSCVDVTPDNHKLILVNTKDDFINMKRMGKKASGRVLDGKVWEEMPTITNNK
jgi:protein gp37